MREQKESLPLEIIERDYAKKPLTAAEIQTIFGNDDPAQFLNTRHSTYKDRNFAQQVPSVQELIPLIMAEPNLLRRPIMRVGTALAIGFDRAKLEQLIKA